MVKFDWSLERNGVVLASRWKRFLHVQSGGHDTMHRHSTATLSNNPVAWGNRLLHVNGAVLYMMDYIMSRPTDHPLPIVIPRATQCE